MAKKLQISKKANDLVSNMILISGPARGGTTILGKLIHTAKEIELAFEPPTLFTLISLINEINEYHWKMIFETFCYEELMLGYLAGRNLNFNINDDSYIFHTKPKDIIEARLKTPFRKAQLEYEAERYILGIKMPDITPFLPKFQLYYPNTNIVIIVRRANDVLNSIIKKKWLDDISISSPNLTWPYRIYKNCKIPYWVEIKDVDWWCEASNIERAGYYYLCVMKPLAHIPNKILINYHNLIEQPDLTVQNLFKKLHLIYTRKTREVVSTVAPTKAKRSDIVSSLPTLMQKKIIALEKKYLC